ncbi:B-box zinc finger protein, partial [bacterium]|nr:B-box zinc finger protein [bacterium]
MTNQVTYCENHRGTVATDTCSQCKKNICYNCRLEVFGNIFCGAQCLIFFLVRKMFKGISRLFHGLSRGIIWPFQSLKKISGRGWIELIIGLGLIICTYFIWNLNRKIKRSEVSIPIQEGTAGIPDTTLIQAPQVFKPTEGGMVTSNTLDITG